MIFSHSMLGGLNDWSDLVAGNEICTPQVQMKFRKQDLYFNGASRLFSEWLRMITSGVFFFGGG